VKSRRASELSAWNHRQAAGRVGQTGRDAGLFQPRHGRPIAFRSYEPLVALSAAAAVTERMGWYRRPVWPAARQRPRLAKQTLSLNALSGGPSRCLGLGGRDDDYAAIGAT